MFNLGIDVGSTSAKVVVLDPFREIVFKRYVRHNARILPSLLEIFAEAKETLGDPELRVTVTGTAGMGVAERSGLPFLQEVVAAAYVAEERYPEVRSLIDLGGEDSKLILFEESSGRHLRPTIRMNGNCAGGTGAFIDQMAGLLGLDVAELSGLAARSTRVYPMASRCGVFAKTDVQTLLSRSIPREDIVASVYRAVAFQTVSSLAHGADIRGKLMFIGGPLAFQPGLRKAFLDALKIGEDESFCPEEAEFVPALGAALHARGEVFGLGTLIEKLSATAGLRIRLNPVLPALFESPEDFAAWEEKKRRVRVRRSTLREWRDGAPDSAENPAGSGAALFLGIDCGSRTSKVVLIDEAGRLLFTYYRPNDGDSLETVLAGLRELGGELGALGLGAEVLGAAASTGYGEELLQSALRLDYGLVETLAHFRAAQEWDPEVSFILDIGGQDMKALFVQDRLISHMDLNEACSSGTGSFIEGFAQGLGYEVADFARLACGAAEPRDLGSRCTVFMNSKVKQALREGAEVGDISAGLAYSVVKNCFQKVLKIHDPSILGTHVVAQGGTFRNPAVLRALELHLGLEVLRPDIPELMGAYGAALLARDRWVAGGRVSRSGFLGFGRLAEALPTERTSLSCRGCENQCAVLKLSFAGEGVFYTGHKCEKVFSNGRGPAPKAEEPRSFNMVELKRRLLFRRPVKPDGEPRGSIGLPRVLNMYEDYPFWATLFVEAGFEVVLSDPSTPGLAERGYSSVMSENVCFPAKIVHGHILNLVAKKVDRIFFPMVRQDRDEQKDSLNCFNCPVVSGYPDLIRSAVNPEKNFGIPLDTPPISFRHPELAEKACRAYLEGLGVDPLAAREACRSAEAAWKRYRESLSREGKKAYEAAKAAGRQRILLLSRPYHADPLVNHRVPEMITALGADVFTDDLLSGEDLPSLEGVEVLTQWAFPNRLYAAALWAAGEEGLEVLQLNSFGCGPDALTVDEVKSILLTRGKNPTLLRVDEVSSPGSLRLRVRSLLESIRQRPSDFKPRAMARATTPAFRNSDRERTILSPMFSPFYTDVIVEAFRHQGYRMVVLPVADRDSVQAGLSYTNHDICYPATIVIGDLVKALKSGTYDPADCAVAITQTGGQCRASSYASLLKKALVDADLGEVPVVTLTAGASKTKTPLNVQPGFKVGAVDLGLTGLFGILYADALAKLYYGLLVREKSPGLAWKKTETWLSRGVRLMSERGSWAVLSLLPKAIEDFNEGFAHTQALPKVGIVGEIFVKFNPFANNYVCDWLKEREVEADVPPLLNFFLQSFVTEEFNQSNHIDKPKVLKNLVLGAGEGLVNYLLSTVNRMLESFRVKVSPFHTMKQLAEGARKVLSLVNQYGESWLIAGDIAGFYAEGTRHVLCLQPFGCIANHIIAKGVEKRLKEVYPDLALLFLDLDAGSSEVNLNNRLEFLVKSAWEELGARNPLAPAEGASEAEASLA